MLGTEGLVVKLIAVVERLVHSKVHFLRSLLCCSKLADLLTDLIYILHEVYNAYKIKLVLQWLP